MDDAEVESAFVLVRWENTIMDEFEGLATQLNSWVPDFDVDVDLGDSSARRRQRQPENTNPLQPGHYRPQLFSETSKQIYLIDVDQRTMFSLQAVINDSVKVLGEESDPQPLFDKSFVKIGPPSGVEVQQVIENGTLTSTVNWSPSPLHPPTKMTIYPGEEEKDEPISTIDLDPSQTETSLDLDASIPADATFTLASSFKPNQWEEGERQRLFFTFPKAETKSQPAWQPKVFGRISGTMVLTPPVITTITVLPSSNSSTSLARVEWNHTTEEFSLLLLLPGDSMITLNKFNEDDDDGFFLGGFNEDGSFIGDYMDTDPDTNRAVMNRLVGFQQLFSKKC